MNATDSIAPFGQIAEYRQGMQMSRVTILAECGGYQLVSATAGYEPAGSMARWTNGYYGVWFHVDGARNGRRMLDATEARELFEAWVQRMISDLRETGEMHIRREHEMVASPYIRQSNELQAQFDAYKAGE
jgi:hypothetical protein